jgi:DNA-binding FadR family transcriptional regulator
VPASTAESAADEVDARQMATLEAEMRQRARDNAEQAAQDAARRKQRAWERFYQAPAFCSDNPTPAQMVQCANHHIRARKEFEERFGAGKL